MIKSRKENELHRIKAELAGKTSKDNKAKTTKSNKYAKFL